VGLAVMTLPRWLWTVLEPLPAVTYFAPQAKQAFADVGYRGFWRGYFAGRAAPLGPVGAAPVTVLFYGFAPGMVARALPSVREFAALPVALSARQAGAVAALTEVFTARSVPADPDRLAVIVDLLTPLARAASCLLPAQTPIGLPRND
jgi:hypothetical protein